MIESRFLTDKEFDQYCFLMRKIKKIKLVACVCREGVENKTLGIDWLHPPKSPESLDSDWMEITREEVKQKINVETTFFVHMQTEFINLFLSILPITKFL